ncbi:MAG: CinA family protein [Spirochaetes bacterium]|nr:CinA family protein [Spirochaetota bacterium]MBU0955821.1 CinA family protein [Spirochaetota bacterium]
MPPELLRSAEHLYQICRQYNCLLAGAESCTGGLASAALTALPGSSSVFAGTVVSYSNRAKQELLDVPAEVFEKDGAVSEACAAAMARGAARRLAADCSWSITGIAGPDGGSAQKPVGLVWFGFSCFGTSSCRHQIFSGDRDSIRQQAVIFAFSSLADLITRSKKA